LFLLVRSLVVRLSRNDGDRLPELITQVGGLPETFAKVKKVWIVLPRNPESIKSILFGIL
jgi:hypothetical protein